MALTALPIGTISYNTRDFLLVKLDDLLGSGKIEDYRAIKHYGEGGDKDHFHVMVFPARRVDTVALRKEFTEVDFEHPGMPPLGTSVWRRSAPDHWLMYAIHDPAYLRSHKKNDEAEHKIEYAIDDIYTPFPDQLQRDFKSALHLRQTESQVIIDALERGEKLTQIMYSYDVSPQRVMAIFNAWRSELSLYEVKENERKAKAAYNRITEVPIADNKTRTLAMIQNMMTENAKEEDR